MWSAPKEFYRDTLGLRLVSEQPPFALVFDANGIMLRLVIAKQVPPARGTVLGWSVPDIAATVKDLNQAGVAFERFEGMTQDELGSLGLALGGEGRVVQRSRWELAEFDRVSWRNEITAHPNSSASEPILAGMAPCDS